MTIPSYQKKFFFSSSEDFSDTYAFSILNILSSCVNYIPHSLFNWKFVLFCPVTDFIDSLVPSPQAVCSIYEPFFVLFFWDTAYVSEILPLYLSLPHQGPSVMSQIIWNFWFYHFGWILPIVCVLWAYTHTHFTSSLSIHPSVET